MWELVKKVSYVFMDHVYILRPPAGSDVVKQARPVSGHDLVQDYQSWINGVVVYSVFSTKL